MDNRFQSETYQLEFDPNYPSQTGARQFGHYSESFATNPQSGHQDLIYVDNYVSIDSRDRDRAAYPNSNQFRVLFEPSDSYIGASTGIRYKNIHSIELKSITVPNTNAVLDLPYLIVTIDELKGRRVMTGTNITLDNAFAKIHLLETTTAFARNTNDYGLPLEYKFKQAPLSWLNSLSISILAPDGTPFNFGTDMATGLPVNELLQTSFVFKITTLEMDTGNIPRRNI